MWKFRKMKAFIIAGLLTGIRLAFSSSAEMIIDRSTPASIIISEQATETEQFAAQELRKYIALMTGMDIPVKGEKEDVKGVIFCVGNNKYTGEYLSGFDNSVTGPGTDSFVIKSGNSRIILVGGGDRGTLYSVYEFLEQQGCRWFMPGKLGEVVPVKGKIIINEQKKSYIPDFIQREISTGGGQDISHEELIDWCAKNRINRNFNIRMQRKEYYPFWRKRGGDIKWQWIAHNYEWILPNQKYFKDHPEYYALYKGERVELGNEKGNVCTTNPDVIRIFADYIIDWFNKNPDGSVFPVSPPDGMIRWCECPECRKLGGVNFMPGERGSMSRRQVVFVNEIAKRVYEKHPDRYLLLLAYQITVDPVPDLKLEKNVVVQVANHGCLAHGIDKCEVNKKMKERFEGWARIAHPESGSPSIWDYFLLQIDGMSGSPLAPLPFARTAGDTMGFLKKLGGRYYFTQAGAVQIYNPLPFYVIAKFTWNTETDFEKLCEDFFDKFYGESARPMKNYWNLLEDAVQNSDWHPAAWSEITIPSPKVFTPEVLTKGEQYLIQAEKLSMNDLVKQRISLVRKSFDYTKSVVTQKSVWILERGENFYVMNAEGMDNDEKLVSWLVDERKRSGDHDRSLSRMIFRLRKREIPVVKLENERVNVAVIPGIGGRIIRLVDKKTGINFMREPLEESSLSNAGTFYFNYGGYEEYIGKAFASPGWEQEYECSLSQDDKFKKVILKTEIPSFSLERVISIEKGASPEVFIKTTLTNAGESEARIMLRVHPEMNTGKEIENVYIYMRRKDGTQTKKHLSSGVVEQPDGMWAAVDEERNVGIINYFDPKQVECYLFYDPVRKFFNMELMSYEKNLSPGESIIINHRYKVVDDAKRQLNRI